LLEELLKIQLNSKRGGETSSFSSGGGNLEEKKMDTAQLSKGAELPLGKGNRRGNTFLSGGKGCLPLKRNGEIEG